MKTIVRSESGFRYRDIHRVWTLIAITQLVGHHVALPQRPKTFHDDGTIMYEYIGFFISTDETIAFLVVKPLHGSHQLLIDFRHTQTGTLPASWASQATSSSTLEAFQPIMSMLLT